MLRQDYEQMSPTDLLYLCDWREAEGEGRVGKAGVAWTVLNRANHPSWWGKDISSVILKPFQFSSFNRGNPREVDWPDDNEPAFIECCQVCDDVLSGKITDPTDGSQYYHDTSIPTPKAWLDAGYILTLEVGRLKFFIQP